MTQADFWRPRTVRPKAVTLAGHDPGNEPVVNVPGPAGQAQLSFRPRGVEQAQHHLFSVGGIDTKVRPVSRHDRTEDGLTRSDHDPWSVHIAPDSGARVTAMLCSLPCDGIGSLSRRPLTTPLPPYTGASVFNTSCQTPGSGTPNR